MLQIFSPLRWNIVANKQTHSTTLLVGALVTTKDRLKAMQLYEGELSNMLLFNQVSVIAINLIPFDFMKWDILVILLVSDRA